MSEKAKEAKEAVKKIVDPPKSKIEILQNAWNEVVDKLVWLEENWEAYQKTYVECASEISKMHPKDQQIFFRMLHRERFQYFLEDLGREVFHGLNKLRVGGND